MTKYTEVCVETDVGEVKFRAPYDKCSEDGEPIFSEDNAEEVFNSFEEAYLKKAKKK